MQQQGSIGKVMRLRIWSPDICAPASLQAHDRVWPVLTDPVAETANADSAKADAMEDNLMHHSRNVTSSLIATAIIAVVATTTSASAKECYAPDARAQERAFSRAVVTEGGKTVWLGGQTGSPTLNFDGQVREIFSELDKTIKAVGGSGLTAMVTMTVFINDVRLCDRLAEIRKETFKECFPGSALITVSGFARPG